MGMANLQRMAQQMQQEMLRVQNELESTIVDGSAGGGVVTATVTGKQEVVSVTIDPSAVDPEDVAGAGEAALDELRVRAQRRHHHADPAMTLVAEVTDGDLGTRVVVVADRLQRPLRRAEHGGRSFHQDARHRQGGDRA